MMRKQFFLTAISILFLLMIPLISGADTVATGEISDTIVWMLDEYGVFTISGTGAMPNYSNNQSPPWELRKGQINKLIVSDGMLKFFDFVTPPTYE